MESKEKVYLQDLIEPYTISDQEAFLSYLKDVWMDLYLRMTANKNDPDDVKKQKVSGVNKIIFDKYYVLPGIIGDRFFRVLDRNNDGYLELTEFQKGMVTLFSNDFEKSSKFIFDFYDFDHDGMITREDIRVVLSYISIGDGETFYKRYQSQEELVNLLNVCFENVTPEKMDLPKFKKVIEDVNSDIYLMILLFLFSNKPFTSENIKSYQLLPSGKSNSPKRKEKETPPKQLIVAPSRDSNFSPLKMVRRNKNRMKTTIVNNLTDIKKLFSDDTSKRKNMKRKTIQGGKVSLEQLKEIQENSKNKNKINPKHIDYRRLKSIRDSNKKLERHIEAPETEGNIEPSFKQTKNFLKTSLKGQNKFLEKKSSQPIKEDFDFHIDFESDEEDEGSLSEDSGESAGDVNAEEVNKFEGILYKFVEGKMRKLYFKIIHRDLYYFKSKDDKQHKGMHNLSGLFLEEVKPEVVDGVKFYGFSVVYPSKTRLYYVDNEKDFKEWMDKLKKATGYTDLTSIYEVKQKLGNGKFGLVKLGINKHDPKEEVAIKIMNKTTMDSSDLELLRTEIEILKICQHPNIIKLYNVFENKKYIYIIMEYCQGGDLFSYLEKRKFKLPEKRAGEIMHKMLSAVYYIHSYGIAHRDLKPENVLMTSEEENSDIRILDFGLSKIIGPDQKCTEPYGTLTYCAPEIIVDEPYDKGVDMWSLGVMTYLMLTGRLPFNANDETEIARQVAFEEPEYVKHWEGVSKEAQSFVQGLLKKDMSKRMKIKEALEHPWIQKFAALKVNEARKNSIDGNVETFKLFSSISGEIEQ